jgi:hypothetical protein
MCGLTPFVAALLLPKLSPMKTNNKTALLLLAVAVAAGFAFWSKRTAMDEPMRVLPPSGLDPKPAPASSAPVQAAIEGNGQPLEPPPELSAPDPTKFQNMGIRNRTAILSQIKKLDLSAILQAGIDADRVERDAMKHQIIFQTILPEAMNARPPSPEFLARLQAYIANPATPDLDRGMLLYALGEVKSGDTARLLLDFATTQTDPRMRNAAAGAVGALGNPNGPAPLEQQENMAPVLEQQWRSSGNDAVLLRSVASGMAVAGATSSIELLVRAALAPAGQDDARKAAARHALASATILNSHAVPPLAARLAKDDPKDEASQFASGVLVRMGTTEANQALVAWLQAASAAFAPQARSYAAGSPSAKAWEAALNPAVTFRSEAVREAIRAGLAERRAGTRPGN